eukprot:9790-Heterococcus_DN1.PRE.6
MKHSFRFVGAQTVYSMSENGHSMCAHCCALRCQRAQYHIVLTNTAKLMTRALMKPGCCECSIDASKHSQQVNSAHYDV